jgi:serine/threonine protein kinase
MTPERWAKVQELFSAASELEAGSRAAFLDDACGEDPELRSEVDSLLASLQSAASGFLESPAIDALPALSPGRASEAQRIARGARLGPYEIRGQLGAGGMGAVYLAADSRLGREVAIKVLPREFSSDVGSARRFEKEARSASALNHPNIVTVYDVGSSDGVAWIAMERIEGETLRERTRRGRLPIKTLLPIAAQIAEGLSKAHDAGIVHRDLKPENVMVTREGLVKILDFGLAKPISAAGPGQAAPDRSTETFTRPGLVVGTAGYMSPEQARGDAVDFRSDQFSLGTILYEMATGRRAFLRENTVDTLSAVLHDDPPPIPADGPPVPAPLLWIIERCLSKEPRRRYAATEDLARDLSTLRDRSSELILRGSMPGSRDTLRSGRVSRRIRALALAVVFALLAAGALVWLRLPGSSSPAPGEIKLRQVTSNPPDNPVQSGTISPDGNYLAYNDNQGMHIRSIATDDVRTVALPEGVRGENVDWEIGPWLPNSTRFYVNSRSPGVYVGQDGSFASTIWSVSVLGGPPRRLRDEAEVYGVAPDGSAVAFGIHQSLYGSREVWAMDPSGGNPRKLLEADEKSGLVDFQRMRLGHRWSYVRGGKDDGVRLLTREARGGPESVIWSLAGTTHPDGDFAWLPDNRLLYTIADPRADPPTCDYWIARVDEETGKPVGRARKLAGWAGNLTSYDGVCPAHTSVTADGKRAAFLRQQGRPIAYVAEVDAGGTRFSNDRRLTLSSTIDVPANWTPDGKAVIVVSNRTGNPALYRHSLEGDAIEQVAPPAAGMGSPRVTPDGNWILYVQDAHPGVPDSEKQVMRVSMAGGPPEKLFLARHGSWLLQARSPDVPAVISEPIDDRTMVISAVDPAKGRGRELFRWGRGPASPVSDDWYNEISPDATQLAVIEAPLDTIRIYSLRGDPPREIHLKDWHHPFALSWTADGKGLYVMNPIQGGAALLHVDLDGNARVIWTDHGGNTPEPPIPSPDGRHVAYFRWSTEGNAWVMEGF